MNILIIIPSLIVWIVAGWFYQQHEHVKFNYSGSLWEKLDNKFKHPWFKNNSRPDLQIHWLFKFIPFTWDGYHFFAWMMKLCYWVSFAIPMYVVEPYLLFVLFVGVIFSTSDFVFSKVLYKWTFK